MRKLMLSVGCLGTTLCGAFAALPSEISTAVTELQTGATDVIDLVIPVVKGIAIALFGIIALWFVYKQVRKALGR